MSDGFRADPEALAAHGAQLGDHGVDAGTIHGQLRDAVAAAGACWGDDEVGRSFAAGHVKASEETLQRLGALPGQLRDVGGRFADTAAAYQRSDQAAADHLTSDEA